MGALMVGIGYLLAIQLIAVPGVILIFIAALLNSLSLKYWSKLCLLVMSLFNALTRNILEDSLLEKK
jgi:hypothetical protein